jgi:hypothetical protein
VRYIDEVFAALARSDFRRSKRLGSKDAEYLRNKGISKVTEHAADFVEKRLAPADPANDGKQTPWRGHPVFVAQHATGTCCRSCLAKWHHIPKGRALSEEEKEHVVRVIKHWLETY